MNSRSTAALAACFIGLAGGAALARPVRVSSPNAVSAKPVASASVAPALTGTADAAPLTGFEALAKTDGRACRDGLKAAGIKFTPVPDRSRVGRDGCGMPHGVIVSRGPTGVAYSPPLAIDCSLAASLPRVEAALQAVAEAELGAPLVKIKTLGGYACRTQRGRFARKGKLSEHSFGNAMDLAEFVTKKGKVASVLRHYKPDLDEPPTAEGRFLRAAERKMRREGGVTRVISPAWDPMHRDHFHLDKGAHTAWTRAYSGG